MAFVGIDVGGTRIKLGLVKQKKMVSSSVFEVKNNHSLEANLPLIIEEIKSLSFAFDASEPIEGIGMALPCLIDHKKNKILSDYVKYPDAKNINLEGWFNLFYKVPFIIENDARAALVGEIEGFEHGTKDAVLVTFGTGIGTAVLSNGAMLRGFNQFAGNLGGHQTIDILGDKCNCGDIGCAESLASGWALHSILEAEESYEMSSLSKVENLQMKDLFKAAADGDPLAVSIYNRYLKAWSYTLKNLVYAYDPEYLILGGGVMTEGENLREYFQTFLDKANWLNHFTVKVVLAQNPDWAGVIGAAILAQEKEIAH